MRKVGKKDDFSQDFVLKTAQKSTKLCAKWVKI